jgi:hypothetical protein
MATQTSALAALYSFHTGDEVLPLGGYDGTIPEPSIRTLATMVAQGRFHLVLLASPGASPATRWVVRHCLRVPTSVSAGDARSQPRIEIYYCGALAGG